MEVVDPKCFLGLSQTERLQQLYLKIISAGPTPPVFGTLARTSTGLILDEPFNDISAWTNGGGWSWASKPALISFGAVPHVFAAPGTQDPDGSREMVVLQESESLWWAINDGGDGTNPWRQWLRRTTDRGLTWEELGEFAGGIGSHSATATGWLEKRGATYIDFVVTAGDLFASPNVGLPAEPYGFEIRTASSMTGSWTVLGTVDPVPATWTADSVLPGGTLKVGSTYYHFAQGKASGSPNTGILTSSSPTGPWSQLDTAPIANSSTALFYDSRFPENPKPFYHPTLDRYVVMVNLVAALTYTDSEALLLSADIEDWSGMDVQIPLHVCPLHGAHTIGTGAPMMGVDGTLVMDATTGFVPFLYDTDPAGVDPGWHLGRHVRGAVFEPSMGTARFTSEGGVLPLSRALAHTDFVAEFAIQFRTDRSPDNIAFEYRRDSDGTNAYRMIVRNGDTTFLQKRVGGSYSNVQVPTGSQHTRYKFQSIVRIEVTTSGGVTTHKSWLDGELQVNATDSDLTSGTYIALSGYAADADVRLLRMYSNKTVTVTGLPPSQDVVVRTATLPINVITADGSGNASISLDHWPHLAIEIDGHDYDIGAPIYGGDVLEYTPA